MGEGVTGPRRPSSERLTRGRTQTEFKGREVQSEAKTGATRRRAAGGENFEDMQKKASTGKPLEVRYVMGQNELIGAVQNLLKRAKKAQNALAGARKDIQELNGVIDGLVLGKEFGDKLKSQASKFNLLNLGLAGKLVSLIKLVEEGVKRKEMGVEGLVLGEKFLSVVDKCLSGDKMEFTPEFQKVIIEIVGSKEFSLSDNERNNLKKGMESLEEFKGNILKLVKEEGSVMRAEAVRKGIEEMVDRGMEEKVPKKEVEGNVMKFFNGVLAFLSGVKILEGVVPLLLALPGVKPKKKEMSAAELNDLAKLVDLGKRLKKLVAMLMEAGTKEDMIKNKRLGLKEETSEIKNRRKVQEKQKDFKNRLKTVFGEVVKRQMRLGNKNRLKVIKEVKERLGELSGKERLSQQFMNELFGKEGQIAKLSEINDELASMSIKLLPNLEQVINSLGQEGSLNKDALVLVEEMVKLFEKNLGKEAIFNKELYDGLEKIIKSDSRVLSKESKNVFGKVISSTRKSFEKIEGMKKSANKISNLGNCIIVYHKKIDSIVEEKRREILGSKEDAEERELTQNQKELLQELNDWHKDMREWAPMLIVSGSGMKKEKAEGEEK